ncbi:oxidation resistance protein 1 [Malassezia sp. CBS 17886]|nr:oxidation resistance protein 1 [Malassezia sp. CBS 17886]
MAANAGDEARGHRRNESFGEFVSADPSLEQGDVQGLMPGALPAMAEEPSSMLQPPTRASNGEDRPILDLRDVERKLHVGERAASPPPLVFLGDGSHTPSSGVPGGLSPAPGGEPPVCESSQTSNIPAPAPPSRAASLWSTLATLRQVTGGLRDQVSHATDLLYAPPPAETTTPPRRSFSTSLPTPPAPLYDLSETRRWNTGSWSMTDAEEREREQKPISVSLIGRRDDTDAVCDAWHAARVQALLPRRLRLGRSWRLVYSLDQHGSSLATLYHRVARAMDPKSMRQAAGEGWMLGSSAAAHHAVLGGEEAQTPSTTLHSGLSMADAGLVLVVQDTDGNVFGAFINEKVQIAPHYYGNGECFLWKTVVRRLPYPPSPSAGEASNADDLHPDRAIEAFPWTGNNDYMVLSESSFLSVGGGDGTYGLWLDDALDRGTSARCPTFNNEVLCTPDERQWTHPTDAPDVPTGDLLDLAHEPASPRPSTGMFRCTGVEVWAVGTD